MIRVSLRISILGLFTTLLILIGCLIVGLNYFVAENILIKAAEKMFVDSSSLTETYIQNFLRPIQQRLERGELIKNGSVNPGPTKEFKEFLLRGLSGLNDAYAIYWANTQGNFELIEKTRSDTLTYETITNINGTRTEAKQHLKYDGSPIDKIAAYSSSYDPRTRPWYIDAVAKKQLILSDIYLFYTFGDSRPELGVTYAYPVYDVNGHLLGVFAIDISLASISKLLQKLQLTPTAKLVVFDKHPQQMHLIASNVSDYVATKNLPLVNDLQIPWVQQAFSVYTKQAKKLLYFKHQGIKYMAFFDQLSTTTGDMWHFAVILPIAEVVGELQRQVLYTVIIAVNIMIIGLLLVWLISTRISRPLIQLAGEVQATITQLEQPTTTDVQSVIKEINYLQDSFNSMKQSLFSFTRYVPLALVKKLIAGRRVAHVGGENKNVTFAFIDIQGFTTISEKMPPSDLMTFLSEYFEAMTKVILANYGTVDKYLGDGIMAFWGAPLDDDKHHFHACNCAILIVKALAELNRRWQETQKPQLNIRIGINSGNAIIGNVGSQDRLSYTAIGDSVNLANRLEALNKYYKTVTIVSQSTYQVIKPYFNFRLLDYVQVRGKEQGVYIYELLTNAEIWGDKLTAYNNAFCAAFNSYCHGDWQGALKQFTELQKVWPQDYLLTIYIERCHYFSNHQPKKWSGVWRFEDEQNRKNFTAE